MSQGDSTSGPRYPHPETNRNLFLLRLGQHSAIEMLMPGPLWLCLALLWLGSCSAHSLFTCEPIEVHRCLEMPYNMTFFPNMMEHYDQDIAASRMEVSPHLITPKTLLLHHHYLLYVFASMHLVMSAACTIFFFFIPREPIRPSCQGTLCNSNVEAINACNLSLNFNNDCSTNGMGCNDTSIQFKISII